VGRGKRGGLNLLTCTTKRLKAVHPKKVRTKGTLVKGRKTFGLVGEFEWGKNKNADMKKE